MKIFIFGTTGMLGTYLNLYLGKEYNTTGLPRNTFDIMNNDSISSINFFKNKLQPTDLIINAAGIIKQKKYTPKELIKINSLFPHELADVKNNFGCNVIHITTDCVFSGIKGSYIETDKHDALDDYGKSKSLGENENLTIIRTSIIGEENQGKKSLIEWAKSNRNKNIFGYKNHLWNGVTCLELAKVIKKIIDKNIFWEGVRHVYSPNTVNKYDLLNDISKIYDLNLNITPIETDTHCYRNLFSIYKMNLVTNNLIDQIKEIKKFQI